jgi:glutathione synthase/RimK-type ligase-like ATP-grasp enzyme
MDYSVYEEVDDLYKAGLLTEKKQEEEPPVEKTKSGEEEDKGRAIKDDEPPVVYADLKAKPTCIFKHIIIFTNDRTDENKTLVNIKDAVNALPENERPKLHIFVAAQMDAEEDESEITISDDKGKFTINKESNLDTLIFSRLGVQGEDECEHAVQLLQDRGFLVLNPIKYSAVACDKYESACLFEKGEIPQPKFCLMTLEILNDENLFKENIKRVYKEYDFKDPDKNADLDVVIKILDGHGGTGVFTCDCKKMIAILQAIFAIDPERKLLIQKKEEADGGDIRVHVLTLRDRQVILAAMKRVKIGGDFRSNVSLGAEAEPVKLTKEQEHIALKTAALSKLPWCAVDIMPLVKGSNKELGDNAVLEINASPGTAGISEVIKTNFVNVLWNELTDPSEFMLQDKTAGFIEAVTINFGDCSKEFLAKLDTGNSTSASTLEVGQFHQDGKKIRFNVDGKEMEYEIVEIMKAKAGNEVYKRPVIVVPELKLGLRKVKNARIAIVDSRKNKSTNMLLNLDILGKLGYVVHPSNSHVLTPEIQRVKII